MEGGRLSVHQAIYGKLHYFALRRKSQQMRNISKILK